MDTALIDDDDLPEGEPAVLVLAVACDPGWPPAPESYRAALPGEELERAARFRRPADAQRFLLGRLLARRALGQGLSCAPASVPLALDANGKPFVAGCALRFNLSHSGEWVVLALARGFEVGVDIEQVKPVQDRAALAAGFFHPREREAGDAMTDEQFLRVWTRKEALSKAIGLGLGLAPDSFAVSGPGREAAVVDLPPPHGPAARWRLLDLPAPTGYVAAAAVAAAAQPRVAWRAIPASTLAG